MDISNNLKNIRENISLACAKAHRDESEVTLIAVTKFVSVDRIAPVLELGVTNVGENRSQELVEKMDFFDEHKCTKHFIGQLQTNKVKYIIGKVELIQSVDRVALVAEVNRLAALRGIVQDILVQVNVGDEAQKGGVGARDLRTFLESMNAYENIHVKGLMCIPPALAPEQTRPYFIKMRELFESCKGLPNVEMQHLSMGMSSDYKEAVEEGATMVRVGSALFGNRM
ncbi:YggS family pyridoxal phosphate-dependent enzyme [Eubacteriales bacterium OttesenSCG-928-K08]|nr:YggS family pyridoxal phosphate-dependent enzyme [Eubacteriales bacterium OttesenSCG-928-K08]